MDSVAYIISRHKQYDVKDKKAREEKLNISDLPRDLSFYNNDVGFITEAVTHLINFYTKNEVYTKEEVNQLIVPKLNIEFVDELPTEDISTSTIYFLKRTDEKQEHVQYPQDYYDEYIYNGQWELIGTTYVDLSDYYKKNEVEEVIDEKILVETSSRMESDAELKNDIERTVDSISNLSVKLNDELEKIHSFESETDDNFNSLSLKIDDEVNRATHAEESIQSDVDSVKSHLSDVENPHRVTKEQIGLPNVQNLSTDETPSRDSPNNVSSGGVYEQLESKVDKIQGYGLSQENFTSEEKTKLSGLSNYDDSSIKERLTSVESDIETLNGDSSVEGSVDKKIKDALDGITEFDFVIVTELPETGKKGIIYLVGDGTVEGENKYTEYIWDGSKFEMIGNQSSTIDLSDYATKTYVTGLLATKQDKLTITDTSATLSDSSTFVTMDGSTVTRNTMMLLWSYIKSKIEANITNGLKFSIVEL